MYSMMTVVHTAGWYLKVAKSKSYKFLSLEKVLFSFLFGTI